MNDSPATAPDTPRPSSWRWGICVFLLLASTLNYMDRLALNQTASRIKVAFGIDNEQYSRLESGFLIAFSIGTLVTGWLVDRISVRWVYPIAVAGWSAAGFLTGYSSNFWTLFGFRLMLGFFEAGNWPCGVRTTRQIMPPAERSLGNAFFQNGTAIGAIITPFIVLMCIQWADPGEPARAAQFAAGGGTAIAATGLPPENVWQVPFRMIGAIGFIWVALWVLLVPSRALRSVAPDDKPSATPTPFTAVFSDRRFWLLVALILAVNMSWHTFRVWLPLFLREYHGYSEADMSYFMMSYYFAADVGSWVVGFATVALTARGRSIHGSRLILFGFCALLLLVSMAVPFLARGPWLNAALLTYGFAALGLFPTYFALSQDLSARHQGKVTGTLGCINGFFMAGVIWIQGWSIDWLTDHGISILGMTKHGPILAMAGLPAILAFVLIWTLWRVPAKSEQVPPH